MKIIMINNFFFKVILLKIKVSRKKKKPSLLYVRNSVCSRTQSLMLRLCGRSDFSAKCLNSPYETECVQNRYKMYANKHNHTQSFYLVRQPSISTRLCPDARISINLVQGLQLVLCIMRLPLYARSFLKPNHF